MFSISKEWLALGPFDIGTREDPWKDSVDILSAYASRLDVPSALCGEASWRSLEASKILINDRSASMQLDYSYPEIGWETLVQTYGWASSQYDAWIVGTFTINSSSIVEVLVPGSPEFLLDGVRYEGDIYSLGTPILIDLSCGSHTICIRQINEVRIFSYKYTEPNSWARLELIAVGNATIQCSINHDQVPNDLFVNGEQSTLITGEARHLASQYVALNISNVSKFSVNLLSVSYSDRLDFDIRPDDYRNKPVYLKPRQTRSVVIALRDRLAQGVFHLKWASADKEIAAKGSLESDHLWWSRTYKSRTITAPHMVTYLNRDGSVGTAILRPPLEHDLVGHSEQEPMPVVLALHGAGVNIGDSAWKNHFKDCYKTAWILQPDCGPWGDDWRSLSALSTESALQSISEWIDWHGWRGPKADLNKILVMGHSNGGEGAMQFIVRNSDRLIGAAWAAGYTSIPRYVPYSLWSSSPLSLIDRPEYDVIRNISMFDGVKCHVRHGMADDNVPIYHSRLLKTLIADIVLEQVPGKGHWWTGVLAEGKIKEFVEARLLENRISQPRSFTLLSWGRPIQKGGLIITQLEEAYVLPASMDIVRDNSHTVKITTHGVRNWTCLRPELYRDKLLELNGRKEGSFVEYVNRNRDHTIYDRRDLTAILESTGPISIINKDPATFPSFHDFELRIAHSLYLYYSLDSEIADTESDIPTEHNSIILNSTRNPNQMGIWLEQDGSRAIATLTAHTPEQMSRLIRLLPWRTGTGVPGRFWMDDHRKSNKITYSSDVDFTVQL